MLGSTAMLVVSVAAPYCWKCGTEVKEDAKICPKCGAALPTAGGVPELSLTVPLVTSLAAVIYLVLRKRIGKKLE